MRLYYFLEYSGERDWGLFEPDFVTLAVAEPTVRAGVKNFDVEMANWIMRLQPMWRAFGYSDIQGSKMAFHAFFSKFQVGGFDPATGLANIGPRAQQAFAQVPPGDAPILTGRVIIFAVVLAIGVLWYLFATGAETFTKKQTRPLWLMRYGEVLWFADCVGHSLDGWLYYKRCSGPYEPMQAMIQNIEAREGKFDRFVFMGSMPHKIKGTVFWHWYNWDYWDGEYIGALERWGQNLYRLKTKDGDRFAPGRGFVAPAPTQCSAYAAWESELTSFW